MQWLRLYSEARTDNKLRTLNDAQHRVWFNLLCYAGEQSTRGEIQERDQYMLAIECSGGDEDLLIETLGILGRLRIIEYQEDGSFRFSAWESRQYDKPSDRPEATAERKRRSREKTERHAAPSNKNDVSRDVTPGHATEQIQNRTDTEQSRAETTAPAAPAVKAKPRKRISDAWTLTDELRAYAIEHGIPAPQVDEFAAEFKRYWQGDGRPKADWDLTFMGRVRDQAGRYQARASPNGYTATKRSSVEEYARLAGLNAEDFR